jgi:hypothetical protein
VTEGDEGLVVFARRGNCGSAGSSVFLCVVAVLFCECPCRYEPMDVFFYYTLEMTMARDDREF